MPVVVDRQAGPAIACAELYRDVGGVGVTDDVLQTPLGSMEQQALDRRVETGFEIALYFDVQVGFLGQAVGQPLHRREEPQIIQQRRPHRVRQRAGLRDRRLDDRVDLVVMICVKRAARRGQMQLNRRQTLDEIIVQTARDPLARLVVGVKQLA